MPQATPQPGGPYARAIGLLLMIKVCIPLGLALLLAAGAASLVLAVRAELARLDAALTPKLAQAQEQLQQIRAEGRRVADQLARIKNEGARAADEIKKSIEPIRRSLVGIRNTVQAISKTAEQFLNAIVRVLRRLPFARGLGRVNLPELRLPGLSLPELDLNIDLGFDMTAVEAFRDSTDRIASETQRTLDRLLALWSTLWRLLQLACALALLWLALAAVGALARGWARFRTGLRLALGHPGEAGLKLL